MRKHFILAITVIALLYSYASAQKVYDYNTLLLVKPSYPGGMSKFYEYVAREIKYPQEAIKNKVEGKVYLSFVVGESGNVSDVKIIKGLTEKTNEEAKRVMLKSPKWNPALLNNKPVRVRYNINVNFKS